MIYRNVHGFAAVRSFWLPALSATMRKSGIPIMLAALWLCTPESLRAQTFTTLSNFNGSNGSTPLGLVQATDGNLYGTTKSSDGTIFKITSSGTLTTLFTFNGLNNDGGASPAAGLVQGTDGNFYGTTYSGGADQACNGGGCGTVFKITPGGTLTALHSFDGTDGSFPLTGLIQGTDGNLYGTTQYGGANSCTNFDGTVFSCGTIFKITPSGTLTTLHSFDGTDGDLPEGALVEGTDGNFYGTTSQGGADQACNGGCGTIFKITPGGTFTTLQSFNYPTDGVNPLAGLIQATDGNFYGTNSSGGVNAGNCDLDCGTIFKITPGGTFTTLHSFDGTDGSGPVALVQASDGNFYGTALGSGANGYGTVFQMTPSGTLTTLHSFDNTDGRNPNALIQDTSGTLYGTAASGASSIGKYHRCSGICGTVFSVSLGLSPFVEAKPGSGMVGAAIYILGTKLTGTTAVAFNGRAAVFTVVSSSEITTTVPSGATTGEVKVVTPGGTLSSNAPFEVVP
jgi:uncharacterized repeat protein (TIGR03803 family)